MKKKRIFISVHWMNIGGVETSLIGLLQSFDYSKVDVDVFVFSHTGPLMGLIPKEANLLPENKAYRLAMEDYKTCLKEGYYKLALAKLLLRLRFGLYRRLKRPKDNNAAYSYMGHILCPVLPDLFSLGEYDLALSFLDPHNFVLKHVRAKKKVGWVHTDYSVIDINRRLERPIWCGLDHVVGVSESVSNKFGDLFPMLKGKIITIENIVSPRYVKQRAEEPIPVEYAPNIERGIPIFCSSGRICAQKNFENLPHMAAELKAMGRKFHWFVIGPGNADPIMRTAKLLGVEEYLSFLGPKTNPYPYIKWCDIYVQPSNFEGKAVAVREAQILCKPVVVTNYPTAASQVKNGVDGVIVPLDNRAIAEGLAQLMDDEDKRREITDYLASHNYGNEGEVEKIYQLMG